MLGRLSAFTVWALVAASAAYWGLAFTARPTAVPANAQAAGLGGPPRGDLARVFGREPAPVQDEAAPAVAESSRFQLVGVVAPRGGSAVGLALIATDGKPARAYRVGTRVEGETVLQQVGARSASLGPSQGPATVRLELPPLPPPATGVPGMPGSPGVPGSAGAAPAPMVAGQPAYPAAGYVPPGYPPAGAPVAPGVPPGLPPAYVPGVPAARAPAAALPAVPRAPFPAVPTAPAQIPPLGVQGQHGDEVPEGDPGPMTRNQTR